MGSKEVSGLIQCSIRLAFGIASNREDGGLIRKAWRMVGLKPLTKSEVNVVSLMAPDGRKLRYLSNSLQ